MARETALLVFPGRGVYGPDELGYLARHHADKGALLDVVDAPRLANGRRSVRELDGLARHSLADHATGENASSLIFACALADAADINRERIDVVAVTGNSLGWYLALAGAGALNLADGARVVDATGALMDALGVGGQLVYPLVDDAWRPDPAKADAVAAALEAGRAAGRAAWSIRLGGMAVLAGDAAGLWAMEAALPAVGRFPMRLAKHHAFHTDLVAPVADAARKDLGDLTFAEPEAPLIDGRGRIHRRPGTDRNAMRAYTFGPQITQTYDFTAAIETGLKEFAPDRIILAGPGSSLAPPIAQIAIGLNWWGLASKDDFAQRQAEDPVVLAMGRADQRAQVVGAPAMAPVR